MARRIVFVELNEVPWRVLDDWVAHRPDSSIGRLLDRSTQFTSVAPDQGHLSPWITWPTVHRGVDNTHHGIGHFGQDLSAVDEQFPPYWTVASDAGRSVGLFGPLHTHPLPAHVERYAFWLPDTFAPDPSAHPGSLEVFQAFNLAMARASARNVSTAIDWRGALRFLLRSPGLGLRPKTVVSIARQLVDERRRPWTRIRRRSFQSVLAFDLFVAQLRRERPELSVLFTNHVASAMHRYWAARYPDDYDPEAYDFDVEWRGRFGNEIEIAMSHADDVLGRLAAFVDRDPRFLLIVASSMGQAAAQATPVRELLLLRDLDRLMQRAGVPTWERRPAMDPMVSVRVDPADARRFAAFLASVTVGGESVRHEHGSDGFFSLEFGQADSAIGEVRVDQAVVAPAELGLEVVSIEDEAGSSAYHVPEGSLFVYDPQAPRGRFDGSGGAGRVTVSTTAIAPAVLLAMGIEPLAHHHVDDRLASVTASGCTRTSS